MSLDIWFMGPKEAKDCQCDGCGDVHQRDYRKTYGDFNYTHNVTPTWSKAGVYDSLYNSAGMKAGSIVPILEKGVFHMRMHPEEYTPLNPPNGWGSYDSAVDWLDEVLTVCRKYPEAEIGVSK